MGILSFTTVLAGQTGNFIGGNVPRRVSIVTTDNLAAVTTAGYLNNIVRESGNTIYSTDIIDMWYGFVSPTSPGTYDVFLPTISNGVITLALDASGGNVLLPVVSGDFAIFNGTTGQIYDPGYSPSDDTKTKVVMADSAVTVAHIGVFADTAGTLGQDAATAINLGNIQAGDDTTKGQLLAYGGSANGHIIINPIGNTGNTAITIQNAVYGQATVLTIPDPGAATANFILSDSSSAQHISGGLTLDTGDLNVSAGNVIAGSSGNAGNLQSFPATAANGELIIAAANAGGAFNTTISNDTMAQSSLYIIPDVGNADGRFLTSATTTPFVSGEFPVASGTGGLMVSSGLAASNIQNKTNIIADSTADIGGGGAGPISVVVANLTAASKIVATIASSTNAVAVAKCIATATGFDITFTADPGAACVVNYVAFVVAQ